MWPKLNISIIILYFDERKTIFVCPAFEEVKELPPMLGNRKLFTTRLSIKRNVGKFPRWIINPAKVSFQMK